MANREEYETLKIKLETPQVKDMNNEVGSTIRGGSYLAYKMKAGIRDDEFEVEAVGELSYIDLLKIFAKIQEREIAAVHELSSPEEKQSLRNIKSLIFNKNLAVGIIALQASNVWSAPTTTTKIDGTAKDYLFDLTSSTSGSRGNKKNILPYIVDSKLLLAPFNCDLSFDDVALRNKAFRNYLDSYIIPSVQEGFKTFYPNLDGFMAAVRYEMVKARNSTVYSTLDGIIFINARQSMDIMPVSYKAIETVTKMTKKDFTIASQTAKNKQMTADANKRDKLRYDVGVAIENKIIANDSFVALTTNFMAAAPYTEKDRVIDRAHIKPFCQNLALAAIDNDGHIISEDFVRVEDNNIVVSDDLSDYPNWTGYCEAPHIQGPEKRIRNFYAIKKKLVNEGQGQGYQVFGQGQGQGQGFQVFGQGQGFQGLGQVQGFQGFQGYGFQGQGQGFDQGQSYNQAYNQGQGLDQGQAYSQGQGRQVHLSSSSRKENINPMSVLSSSSSIDYSNLEDYVIIKNDSNYQEETKINISEFLKQQSKVHIKVVKEFTSKRNNNQVYPIDSFAPVNRVTTDKTAVILRGEIHDFSVRLDNFTFAAERNTRKRSPSPSPSPSQSQSSKK